MGQAKRRGSFEDRLEEAQFAARQLLPEKITCNYCKTEISDLQITKPGHGVIASCYGVCPSCQRVTLGMISLEESLGQAERMASSLDSELGTKSLIEKIDLKDKIRKLTSNDQ